MEMSKTRKLAVCAMIAALYTALCLATPAISYNYIQVRIAEALTLLPVFSPIAIWGVTLGCALSNFVGFLTGANMLGYLDIFFGTGATLIAAVCSFALRNVRFGGMPVLSVLPPILVNAVVIGGELAVLEVGALQSGVWLFNGFYVGLGQAIACIALGLPMVAALRRTGVAERYLPERVKRVATGEC